MAFNLNQNISLTWPAYICGLNHFGSEDVCKTFALQLATKFCMIVLCNVTIDFMLFASQSKILANWVNLVTTRMPSVKYDCHSHVDSFRCWSDIWSCFQEQAVFKQTYRSATVLSHTATELLCIDASDLASIYMCGRDKPIIDKEVMDFLGTVDFLRDFPRELLMHNPQAIMFHYFQ